MPLEDKATRRRVEHELARFDLDLALLSVAVINQVAYLNGRVRRMRGVSRGPDTKQEMRRVVEAILQLPGIKDVMVDCQFE